MEPSDYFPDSYYRSPPDEPLGEVVSDRPDPSADQMRNAMIRHQGLAEHYHVQRADRAVSDRVIDLET